MKKIISFLTVFCIMVPLWVPIAGAASVEKAASTVEIFNYSAFLSEEDAERIKDGVSATAPSANGEVIPLDCTVTIRDVVDNAYNMYSLGGHTYAVTVSAVQKETDPEIKKTNANGVIAKATITMIWTDVPGIANTIDNLSGGVEITKGTFKNGKVSYGHSHNRPMPQPYFKTGTSFNEDVSYTSTALTGSVHAHFEVWFDEWSDTSVLRVCVEPSILD